MGSPFCSIDLSRNPATGLAACATAVVPVCTPWPVPPPTLIRAPCPSSLELGGSPTGPPSSVIPMAPEDTPATTSPRPRAHLLRPRTGSPAGAEDPPPSRTRGRSFGEAEGAPEDGAVCGLHSQKRSWCRGLPIPGRSGIRMVTGAPGSPSGSSIPWDGEPTRRWQPTRQ